MSSLVLLFGLITALAVSSPESDLYCGNASHRGQYKIVESYDLDMEDAYGIAIFDDQDDRIWISEGYDYENHETIMSTGKLTGVKWSISCSVDIDALDQAYCEYDGIANQIFFGNYCGNNVVIWNAEEGTNSAVYNKRINGPSGGVPWKRVYGVAAGNGHLYASSIHADQIAWAKYSGTERSVKWSTAPMTDVYGMAVWDNYLFIIRISANHTDDILILELNSDGSPNMTPVWSCPFIYQRHSGIDYDGEFLWIQPFGRNCPLYKLEIDFMGGNKLETSTWGGVKNSFRHTH